MKIAIVGSRKPGRYAYSAFTREIPKNATRVISGGAMGIDRYAKKYALDNDIDLTEILPDYQAHPGKLAPILRNRDIVEAADYVLSFWTENQGAPAMSSPCASSLGSPIGWWTLQCPMHSTYNSVYWMNFCPDRGFSCSLSSKNYPSE